ncbi:MAG TPA: phosphatidylglycerophosphatase A [Dyella sp.]|uniref:phosphatidylglycerophosphatase A family protein n=1 Tax=Dyella sp. TaxID=1869338 RepID=UPI002F954CD8
MSDRKRLSAEQRRALLASPDGWLACGFGSGLMPVAQGTFGSLAALLPWWWLRHWPWPAYLLLLAMAFALGVWACDTAGKRLGVDDHRSLVWDEFVGQWIALLPALFLPFSWWMLAGGFVLFRVFDVAKPWPIGWVDRRVKGGFGVMVDDVIAGVFAAIALIVLGYFLAR